MAPCELNCEIANAIPFNSIRYNDSIKPRGNRLVGSYVLVPSQSSSGGTSIRNYPVSFTVTTHTPKSCPFFINLIEHELTQPTTQKEYNTGKGFNKVSLLMDKEKVCLEKVSNPINPSLFRSFRNQSSAPRESKEVRSVCLGIF